MHPFIADWFTLKHESCLVSTQQDLFLHLTRQDNPVLNFDSPKIPALKIHTRHVKAILQNLAVDKALGPDDIPLVLLKSCLSSLASILSKFFRQCIVMISTVEHALSYCSWSEQGDMAPHLSHMSSISSTRLHFRFLV